MNKFCPKCGDKLEEGKACNCEGASETKKEVAVKKSKGFVEDAKAMFKDCLNIFINPKEVVEEKKVFGNAWIIAMIIQAVVVFVTLLIGLDKLLSVIGLGGFSFSLGDIPFDIYVKIGIVIIISVLVFLFAFVSAIYLIMNKLLKVKCEYKEVLNKFSYPSLIMSATILAAVLLSYILPELIYLVLGFGFLYFTVITYAFIKSYFKVEDNHALLYTPVVIMISIIAGRYIIPEVLERIIGGL